MDFGKALQDFRILRGFEDIIQQKKGFLSEIAKVLFDATHPFFNWSV